MICMSLDKELVMDLRLRTSEIIRIRFIPDITVEGATIGVTVDKIRNERSGIMDLANE